MNNAAAVRVVPPRSMVGFLQPITQMGDGRAEEVVPAVSFLVSDRASYISGQVLRVDGGMYM